MTNLCCVYFSAIQFNSKYPRLVTYKQGIRVDPSALPVTLQLTVIVELKVCELALQPPLLTVAANVAGMGGNGKNLCQRDTSTAPQWS